MFSSDDGSDGDGGVGSDVDSLIEQRLDGEPVSPEIGAEDKVAVIGIVGASSTPALNRPLEDNKNPNTSSISSISSRLGHRLDGRNNNGYDNYSSGSYGSDGRRPEQILNPPGPSRYYRDRDRIRDEVSGGNRAPIATPGATAGTVDSNGTEITQQRLSDTVGPFFFMGLPTFQDVYRMMYSCPAMPPGIKQQEYNRGLCSLTGFMFYAIRGFGTVGPVGMLNFVERSGPEFRRMRQRLQDRLLGGNVVIGPQLYYNLLVLACMPLEMMTGRVASALFKRVTDRALENLDIVTDRGIRRLRPEQVWGKTCEWAKQLCEYMALGSRMQESLDRADMCYDRYVAMCREKGGGTMNTVIPDPTGAVAQEMLQNNVEEAMLFLGIRSTELRQLYKYLVCMMSTKVLNQATMKYLRQVSESLRAVV